MDNERFARYRQKLGFITEKVHSIKGPLNNDITKDAMLYRIQTSIESAMDVIAMLVKDKGRDVSDDYNNIHTLQKLGVITKVMADELTSLNGLRNAIVHKYNSFEEKTVIHSMSKIKAILTELIEHVETTIKKDTK